MAERKSGGEGPGGAKPQSLPIVIPEEEVGKPHRFWDQQPVPSVTDEIPCKCGPIDAVKKLEDIRQTPLPLPEGFEWVDLNTNTSQELDEVYDLLKNHYVEDDGACFRFEYSKSCLRWALNAPGSQPSWNVGIRAMMKPVGEDGPSVKKLVAFISGIPIRINVCGNSLAAGEINFLCVHKTLRNRRLAPVLIKEITRRINLKDIWHALYTAGIFIPRPVTDCRYWHRPLNIRKLVSVGFSCLRPGQTMEEAENGLALPADFTEPHIRVMELKDVSAVARILRDGYARDGIKLFQEMDEEDVEHWLVPRAEVVQTYVKETPRMNVNGEEKLEVTDVFSFYILPSTVLRHRSEHTLLNAAYAYYANGSTLSRFQLLQQTIIAAKMNGHDVLNALDLHHNLPSFDELHFGPGDGSLKYYLYNYQCPIIHPSENSVILL